MLDPVQALAVSTSATQVTSGAKIYYGATIQAGTASTVVNIRNGTSTAGSLIDVFHVAANTEDFHFATNGVQAPAGIFFDTDGANAASVVFFGPI